MRRTAAISLALFGVAALTLAALLALGDSRNVVGQASYPTTQPNCYVADEPTASGPAAPSNLTASYSFYLYDGYVSLSWDDNSDSENCFVIETKVNDGSYEMFDQVPANTDDYVNLPWGAGDGDRLYFRVYAATSSGRSEYSNEDSARIYFDLPPSPTPTPSASPTPSLTPSPSTVTPTPTPSTATLSPTPAALPKTGGRPD
jgi:hypothetical protein